MELYIIRHGIASEPGTAGMSDEERPLTAEGVRKMRLAAAGFRHLDIVPPLILSSPLVRAYQTAEILADEFGKGTRLEIAPELSPGGSRTKVFQEIAVRQDLERLMLVGHQPSLGEIAGEIAFGSAGCCLELKKGGGCGLRLLRLRPAPRGTLLWLLPPSILRATK